MSNTVIYSSKNNRLYLFCMISTFCIQCTDVKLFSVKLSEVIMILYVLLFVRTIRKSHYYIASFFVFYLIVSLSNTTTVNIYQPSAVHDMLKKPYVITFVRFLEYVSCMGFVIYVSKEFEILSLKGNSMYKVVESIIDFNVFLSFIYIFEYILILLGIISIDNSFFHYANNRLKGFYVEGGPLGLCYAFLSGLCYAFDKSQYNRLKLSVLIITILLAQSKSGVLCVIFFLLIIFFYEIKISKFWIIASIPAILFISIISFQYIARGYLKEISEISSSLATKGDDYNLVMGRISATYITPNIITDNPLWGVGMGNYPLVRNNPQYRDRFPEVELWDASGLGGIIDMLMEGGLIIVSLFALTLWKMVGLTKRPKRITTFLLAFFLMPFVFGVQLHFMYSWFAIGMLSIRQWTSSNEPKESSDNTKRIYKLVK